MKRKLFFSLVALVAIVITGFALNSNSTAPSSPTQGMLFVVHVSGNDLVQDCAESVKMTFNGKTMVKPYTGAAYYYFFLPKTSFTGTACAMITTDGTCGDNVEILGQCVTDSWSQGDLSHFTVTAQIDEL